MYEYICSHPLVLKGVRRETHYFDWRWNTDLDENDAEKHRACYLATYFNQQALHQHPSLITGESTPSYLLHGDVVIPRVQRVCPPGIRIIVMLRNPVDRAYSQFQMSIDTKGTPEQLLLRGRASYAGKPFAQVVEEEIAELESLGIDASSSYEAFLPFLASRPMGHGGHSIIARGLYALQLQPWLAAFPADQIRIFSLGEIKGSKEHASSTMEKVFTFVGLPPNEIGPLEPQNTRVPTQPMDEAVRERLSAYYEPFNQRLFQLIGKHIDDW